MLVKDVLSILIKRQKCCYRAGWIWWYIWLITVEHYCRRTFGEIEDEHDSDQSVDWNAVDTFKLSARLEVDYINERYKLDLPENEQYETLGGLIVHEMKTFQMNWKR
jgi:Mg2+/Co2+ transporter CorC